MGFLHRSKSQAMREQKKGGRKDEPTAERTGQPLPSAEEKKSMFREQRPRTADKRKSFSRPRTATGASGPPEPSTDFDVPVQTIEIKQGKDVYNFPTPSPRLPPPRSATYHNSHSPLGESPHIGMAIGSPSQAPPQWGRSFTADAISSRMPAKPLPSGPPHTVPEHAVPFQQQPEPELRRKRSGWKTIGEIFGRKPSKQAIKEPFYKVRMHPDLERPAARIRLAADSPSPMAQSPDSVGNHHKRAPSITRGMARFEARAEADRAAFMPGARPAQHRRVRTPSMVQKEGFSPSFQPSNLGRTSADMFKTIADERNDSPLSVNERTHAVGSPRTPRLDLEIPNGEMERYSVMFGKLLDERRPSILERRQSKMKQKKSVEVLQAVGMVENVRHVVATEVLQRSVTSPHLKKSLSIKVGKKVHSPANAASAPADEPMTAIHQPRPIQRSRTAPPGSVSPLAHNFSKPKPAPTLIEEENLPDTPSSAISENSLPPTPTTLATVSSLDDSVAILNDLPKTPKIVEPEPSWDMVTSTAAQLHLPPDSNALPSTTRGRDRLSRAVTDPYARVRSPEDLEKQIVQVSVARQVSVTKARKQVRQAVDSKQPLRPRVVNLSKNDRKSTVVVIEGGGE